MPRKRPRGSMENRSWQMESRHRSMTLQKRLNSADSLFTCSRPDSNNSLFGSRRLRRCFCLLESFVLISNLKSRERLCPASSPELVSFFSSSGTISLGWLDGKQSCSLSWVLLSFSLKSCSLPIRQSFSASSALSLFSLHYSGPWLTDIRINRSSHRRRCCSFRC